MDGAVSAAQVMLFLWLAPDRVFPFPAFSFDAVHEAARPYKFSCKQAQAKENCNQTGPGGHKHHQTCQQQGKSSDNEENSADLLNGTEDHSS
jgi:hypothetical protein